MLKHYRDASDVEYIKNCKNEQYIKQLLTSIFAGMGIIFIAENEKPIGMLMAVITSNIWDSEIKELNELAYWVEPESRGGSAGYRLLKSYADYGEKLKKEKRIQKYTVSKMFNSPDLKYDKLGFVKLEEKWIK